MSVLSDKEIKSLCQIPNVEVTEYVRDGFALKKICRYEYIDDQSFMLLEEETNPNRDSVGVISYKILSGEEIALFKPMITPFIPRQVRCHVKPELVPVGGFELGVNMSIASSDTEKILSYGLSSYGYDVRLADDFKIFTNINSTLIDPLNFDEACLHDHKGDYVIIPPNSYILGRTIEYFKIPKDVVIICVGKSTYARCGAIVNVTPIEPGFEGHVVIEISNSTSLPLKVYANQGISQFIFFKGTVPCEVSYADRGGKYQGQKGITLPKG